MAESSYSTDKKPLFHPKVRGLQELCEVYSQCCPRFLLYPSYQCNGSNRREIYASHLPSKSQEHLQDKFLLIFGNNANLLLDVYSYSPNSSGDYGQPEKNITCFKSRVLYVSVHTLWLKHRMISQSPERPQMVYML